jgi:two-component sensor histidine kinase/PAS domain-containing protein
MCRFEIETSGKSVFPRYIRKSRSSSRIGDVLPPAFDQTDAENQNRLAALDAFDILDTAPEPEFDDVVFVASSVCRTPVALISLIGADRQWFKASVGFEARETPLEHSVCAHALASTDPLVIPDLTKDERTRNNPLVVAPPAIRFYAGAPLVLAGGTVVGTLCVIDTVARPEGLDTDQLKILQALSRQVVALLEARRASNRKDELFRRQRNISSAMRSYARQSIAAQEAGRIGTFELDIATGEIKVSAEFCRIFDVPVAESYPASFFEDMVPSEDEAARSNAATRTDGTAAMDVEYRINTRHRGMRWIARQASFSPGEDGRPDILRGTVQDVTATRRSAARAQALLDLGDRLRDLDDIESMAIAAADLMAKALDATRAGFGVVDIFSETVFMQPEWCTPGVRSIAGPHDFRDYGTFIDDLKLGRTVIIEDVAADPRTSQHAQALLGLDIRMLINVPVFDHGRFSLVVFVHYDHTYDWTADELAFVRSFGDRMQIALARVRAEAEQDILNREISHRLKNTFAMIQAIATQTLRPVTEREPVENFERRLHALSRAHDILLQDNWLSADVADLVTQSVETFGVIDRLKMQGPKIAVGARGSLSLALLLHELVTNAIKYGSLSTEQGHVIVRWSIEGRGEQATFNFSWHETGGPPASEPVEKGFGSKLIKMGLIGSGGAEARYSLDGFSVKMSASLSQMQRSE